METSKSPSSLIKMEEEISPIETFIGGYTCTSEKDVVLAANYIVKANLLWNHLEVQRKAECDPKYKAWKESQKKYTPFQERLVEAKKKAEEKILQWRRQEQNRIEQERAAVERDAKEINAQEKEAGEVLSRIDSREVVPELSKTVKTPDARASVRKKWKVKVLDIKVVPTPYLMLNESLALESHAAILQNGGSGNIPGLFFHQEEDGITFARR